MEQDWIWGLLGGVLIGIAGAILLLANGRVMGASGIFGGLVDKSGWSSAKERIIFIVGVMVFPLAVFPFYDSVDTHLTDNYWVIIIGGILVGLGSRTANGCTSGHGVCGISRFSLRGIVATVFYISAGGAMILVARHLLGII
jgi:uncharacterized membrane protein YedE/YeeE